jgi:hypothetical protein
MIHIQLKNLLPLMLGVSMFATLQVGRGAETVAATNAPAGLYVSFMPDPAFRMKEQITVDLKTNRVYSVLVISSRTNKETGTWRWDGARKQFSLTPTKNRSTFPYPLRVLRVDPEHADTLKWTPVGDIDPTSGSVEYFKFKRKHE